MKPHARQGSMRLQSTAVLLAIGLFAAGCSSVSVSSERSIGAPTLAPTEPASVEILQRRPGRRAVRLGMIYLEPSGNPPVEELEKALRTEAAKMGANAVAVVRDRTRRVGRVIEGPWWDRTAHPVYGRKIVAVALRVGGE
jgi:hypothetical protein